MSEFPLQLPATYMVHEELAPNPEDLFYSLVGDGDPVLIPNLTGQYALSLHRTQVERTQLNPIGLIAGQGCLELSNVRASLFPSRISDDSKIVLPPGWSPLISSREYLLNGRYVGNGSWLFYTEIEESRIE